MARRRTKKADPEETEAITLDRMLMRSIRQSMKEARKGCGRPVREILADL